MRYQPLFGTYVLALLFMANNGPQRERSTNYEILNAQVDTVALAITSALARDSSRTVDLKAGSHEVDAFVRQRILENLLRDRFRVMSDSSASPTVRIFVPLVEVSYSAPVSSHIFGSSEVVRTVRSDYNVEISDGDRVNYARSFSLAFSDTVSESEIPDLEAGSYPFLHGRLESTSLLDTIFQPLLFAASAAVIVYLFFTLRGS